MSAFDIFDDEMKVCRWKKWQGKLFFDLSEYDVSENSPNALLRIILMDYDVPDSKVFEHVSDLICEAYLDAYGESTELIGTVMPIMVGQAVYSLTVGIMEANPDRGVLECFILTNLIFQHFEQSFNLEGMEQLIKQGRASRA